MPSIIIRMSDDNSPSHTGADDATPAAASAARSGSSPQDCLDLTLSDSDDEDTPTSTGATLKSRLYVCGNYGKSLRPRDTVTPQKRSSNDTPKVVTPRGGTTRKRLKKVVTSSSNSSSSESPTPQKRVQFGEAGYRVTYDKDKEGKNMVFHGEVVEGPVAGECGLWCAYFLLKNNIYIFTSPVVLSNSLLT